MGSHLTEALLARGDDVVAVDSFTDYYDPSVKEENARAFEVHAVGRGRGRPPARWHRRRFPPRSAAGRPRELRAARRRVPASQRARDAACVRAVGRTRRLRVVFVGVRRRGGVPDARVRAAASDLPVRDHEARVRAPRACARRRRGRPALLHRLWATAATRHGVRATRRRGARGARVRSLRLCVALVHANSVADAVAATIGRNGARDKRARSTTSAAATRRRCARRSVCSSA